PALDRVIKKIPRKPEGITRREGVVGGRQTHHRLRLIELEPRLTRGRHRGHRISGRLYWPRPSARYIALGSRAGRVRHLRNSRGDILVGLLGEASRELLLWLLRLCLRHDSR